MAAPLLLGSRITSRIENETVSGIINEVEAYTEDDSASHTFKGMTARNQVMFGPAGRAYVYFTYGMHYCMNIVCGSEGKGEAVLIRSIIIDTGIELAIMRRYGSVTPTLQQMSHLSNGPGKLVQALGITMSDYGIDVTNQSEQVSLSTNIQLRQTDIARTTRIGISKGTERQWRWVMRDMPKIIY